MANDVEIGARLQVDTGNSGPSIKQMRDYIADLKKELAETTVGSEKHIEIQKKLTASNEVLNPKLQEQATGFSAVKEHLSSTIPAFRGASEGVSSFGNMMKKLLLNPVVLFIAAIVAGLKFLYDAFTATDNGGQKVTAMFDGIGSVLRELMQRASSFANAIVKIMTGDFKGAMEEGKKSVTGFGDAMVDSFKRGKEASDLLDDVADATRVLDIQYAAMNARLAKSRELLTDENASYKDKKNALKESGEDIEAYYKKKTDLDEKEITAIAKKYNIEKQVNILRKKGYEVGAEDFDNYLQTLAIKEKGIEEIEGSIKKAIQSNAEYSAKSRQQNRSERMLDIQQAQKDRQAAREAMAKRKEERQKADQLKRELKTNYQAFSEKITKLREENELAIIQDADAKKIKELQFSLASQKALIEKDFEEKKITGTQRGQLFTELEKNNQIKINKIFEDAEKQRLSALQKTIEARKTLIQVEDALSPEQTKQRANLIRQATLTESQIKLQDLQMEYDARMELVRGNEAAELDTKKWYSDQKKQIDQAELNFKLQMYDQIGAGISALGGLFDKGTAAAKIAALADIGIGTATGFIRALEIAQKSAAATGPAAAFAFPIFYASQIAAVLGAAGRAKSVLSGAGTTGGGAPLSPSVGATAAPLRPVATATTTRLPQDQIDQMGNAVVRAYVITTDINNDQQKIAQINRAARLT